MRKVFIGTVVLPEGSLPRGAVVIEDEKISVISPMIEDVLREKIESIDCGDHYIAPGFIDLHLHGALGKDIMDADAKSLRIIASYQARCGVTGYLGATMSSSVDSFFTALEAVKSAFHTALDSEILGIYLEGPFINVNKTGAHDPQFVGFWNEENIIQLLDAVQGLEVIVPVAPEISGHMDLIEEIQRREFVAAIGHSAASYSQACASFLAGISHATHLFNAMPDFHHREPGVVGAVLDTESVTAEIIADGVHVHPSLIRVALARKGVDRICLATDSVNAAGLGNGLYELGYKKVFVEHNRAVLLETDTLAGSVISMNQAVKNVREWCGLSVPQAVKMATLNPARVLGLDCRIGSLEEGKQANLVVLDKEFNVIQTILRGRDVYTQS